MLGAALACAGDRPTTRADAMADIAVVEEAPEADERCRPGAARGGSRPDTLVLTDAGPFPCRVYGVPCAALGPSPDGSRPDPGGFSAVRTRRGTIITRADSRSARGMLLVWDSAGRFQRTLGGPGDGPGEFSPNFLPTPYRGPADSLFVDEYRRWSVFDPDLEFARIMRPPQTFSDHRATAVTERGELIMTGTLDTAGEGAWFHVVDGAGTLRRSFGSVEEDYSDRPRLPRRSIAYGGGDRFWAAPPGSSKGYVLEEWTTDGELVRVIRREVPWMHEPVGGDRTMVLPDIVLHLDSDDLLWVSALVRDPRWEAVADMDTFLERQDELLDHRIEVIDPRAGRVLAAALIDAPSRAPAEGLPNLSAPIHNRVPDTREGSGSLTDDLGFRTIRLIEWFVVEK